MQVRILYLHGASGNAMAMAGFGGASSSQAEGRPSARKAKQGNFSLEQQERVRFRVLGSNACHQEHLQHHCQQQQQPSSACYPGTNSHPQQHVLELQPCDLARCATLWTSQVLSKIDRLMPSVLAALAAEVEAARNASSLTRGSSRVLHPSMGAGGVPKGVVSKTGSGAAGGSAGGVQPQHASS
eukprot:scaffold268470_cov14-Tisochrysis_lutea.AAC.1